MSPCRSRGALPSSHPRAFLPHLDMVAWDIGLTELARGSTHRLEVCWLPPETAGELEIQFDFLAHLILDGCLVCLVPAWHLSQGPHSPAGPAGCWDQSTASFSHGVALPFPHTAPRTLQCVRLIVTRWGCNWEGQSPSPPRDRQA